MRKFVLLITVLVLAAATTTVVLAGDKSPVQYTFTFTDLGQGGHGAGPLYADGSANGHMAFSAMDGQVIVHLHATSWSWVVPGETIDICFDVHQIKGPPLLPPSICFSDAGIILPVSGTPVLISNPFADQALVRVTPAN